MNTSESIDKIAPALVEVQEDMVAIKDKNNPFFKSKYAPLDEILKSVRPTLKKNGLTVIQGMQSMEKSVVCTTRIMHKSGQWIDSEMPSQVDKQTPQGFGSAATYARRYGLCAALSISTPLEDDDGNKAEEDNARQKAKQEKEAKLLQEAKDLEVYRKKTIPKFAAYEVATVKKCFEDRGHTSEKENDVDWLEDVIWMVPSIYQLKQIGKAVKDASEV